MSTENVTIAMRFDEYKRMVIRAIVSCTNNVQLMVAFDFKDLFYERFSIIVDAATIADAASEIETAYLNKQAQLHI